MTYFKNPTQLALVHVAEVVVEKPSSFLSVCDVTVALFFVFFFFLNPAYSAALLCACVCGYVFLEAQPCLFLQLTTHSDSY